MAFQRRALLAFVAVCALLLAVGSIGPREPAPDHRATEAVAVGSTAATAEPIAGVTKQVSPPVLIAAIEVAATRRGRQRVLPHGTQSRRTLHRRLWPAPAAQVDERFARMAVVLPEPVGRFRY